MAEVTFSPMCAHIDFLSGRLRAARSGISLGFSGLRQTGLRYCFTLLYVLCVLVERVDAVLERRKRLYSCVCLREVWCRIVSSVNVQNALAPWPLLVLGLREQSCSPVGKKWYCFLKEAFVALAV